MDINKFLPSPELKAEFEAFAKLRTEEEKNAYIDEIQEKYDGKTKEERSEYRHNLVSGSKALIDEAKILAVKRGLLYIKDFISLAEISKTYFGKSRYWLSQRINENTVNGKPVKFTDEELKRLSVALDDLANKLKSAAELLHESA